MNLLKNYYTKIIKQDFINKFKTPNNTKIPKLKKITLNFGCKNFSIQKFATTMLALEIITTKKALTTTSKKQNILLKIQKGQPAGGKVELENNEIHFFINKLNLEILPKFRNFSGFNIKDRKHNFHCQLPKNSIKLYELETQDPLFADLPTLDINVSTNSKNTKKLLFFIKSMKLSISKYQN